jgi:hypothetical protein
MAEIAFAALFMGAVAFGTIAVWVGLQIYNELTITRLNNAVVSALSEGSYRNSYKYRAIKRGKKNAS